MYNINTKKTGGIILNNKTRQITFTALFLAIAIVSQFVGSNLGGAGFLGQYITGTIVNICLMLSGIMVGVYSGLTIGVLSPCLAFLLGVMKFPFAIPVVIAGNIVFVLITVLIYKAVSEKTLGLKAIVMIIVVIAAAAIKALVMWFSAKYLLNNFTAVPAPLIASFAFPQVITGSLGGLLSLALLPILKKAKAI